MKGQMRLKCYTYQDYLDHIYLKMREAAKQGYERKTKKAIYGLAETTEEYDRKNKKVNNPHDKIFRSILENKTEVTKLINKTLKRSRQITEDEIEIYNSSYINLMFQNQESDIVYKMKKEDIFFLIEHQTKKDYEMPKRILNYEIEIMRMVSRKNKRNPRDPEAMVIPIVIYTGKEKWNIPKDIEKCRAKMEEIESIQLGKYYMVDINKYKNTDLKNDESLLSKIMLIEKSKNPEELKENFQEIIEKETEEKNIELIKRMIFLIYKETLGEEEKKKLLDQIQARGGVIVWH